MIIEIRSAEGGKDSKLFVQDMAIAFEKMASKKGWKNKRLLNTNNQINVLIETNENLVDFAGGHRIQRVPTTEKKDRVQTSTVTVAIVDGKKEKNVLLDENDLKITWFSGTGKGGQHRNKHQNSCKVIHLPTGIVETRQGRVRNTNLTEAKNAIQKRVNNYYSEIKTSKITKYRKKQVGSGMRGDKNFTYRFQDGIVKNHQNGKTMKIKKYFNGNMLEILV